MAAAINNSFFAKKRAKGLTVVDDPPKLDLDAYIANYKGRTRFERLLLVGTTSTHLCLDALKGAVAEAKLGNDVERYETAVTRLREIYPDDPGAVPDNVWTEKTKKIVKVETDRLESELKGYKNNLIKESIRMGYQDLGKHYHSIGDLASSLKSFAKMQEFMTSNTHLISMVLHNVQVSIDHHNWYNVFMNVSRVYSNGQTKYEEAKKQTAKLTSAMGIASLASQDFRSAADHFIDTDPRMTRAHLDDPDDEEAYNEVLTPNDVAVYGGLCALASYSRKELQTKVLDHKTFRTYLELEPHIRRAITFFIAAKYSSCLAILDSWKVDYLLDIYLQPCLHELYFSIRSKAIQQYFIPFSSVSFSALASAFTTEEHLIETELTQMIRRGDLDARLDLVDRVLISRVIDSKADLHDKALATAESYEKTAQLRILRMAVLNAGLEVKPSRDKMPTNRSTSPTKLSISNSAAAGDLLGRS